MISCLMASCLISYDTWDECPSKMRMIGRLSGNDGTKIFLNQLMNDFVSIHPLVVIEYCVPGGHHLSDLT